MNHWIGDAGRKKDRGGGICEGGFNLVRRKTVLRYQKEARRVGGGNVLKRKRQAKTQKGKRQLNIYVHPGGKR